MTALVAIAAIVALFFTTKIAFEHVEKQQQPRLFPPAPAPQRRGEPRFHIVSNGTTIRISTERTGKVLASFHDLDNARAVAEEIAHFGLRRLENV